MIRPVVWGGGGAKWIVDSFWIGTLSIFLISAQSFKRCNQVIRRLSETKPVSLSNDPPRRGGRGRGSRANGSFPKGAGRLSEKSPAGYPPPHHRDDTPGSAGVRPHAVPSVAAQFPCDVATDRPAGRNSMGPAEAEAGRRCRLIPAEEMAEAARGFVRAGRPRSRGGLSPMTGSHQRDKSAEAFWRQLSLKEVHQSSCLFVFIGGSSSLTNGCFPSE